MYKITFVNSQHKNKNSKGDILLKNWCYMFFLKMSGIQKKFSQKTSGKYLHIWILNKRIEKVCGLYQAQARVTQGCNTSIHTDTNSRLIDIIHTIIDRC